MTYAELKPDLRGRLAFPIQAQRFGLLQRQPPGQRQPFQVDQVLAHQSLTADQQNDFHRLDIAQPAPLAQVVPILDEWIAHAQLLSSCRTEGCSSEIVLEKAGPSQIDGVGEALVLGLRTGGG